MLMEFFADLTNIGYDSDRAVYRNLIKAKELIGLFSDPFMVRQIYNKAQEFAKSDEYYHHQRGLYEMKRSSPNLDESYKELKIAEKLASWDKTIQHSIAELELERARNTKSPAVAEKHLANATRITFLERWLPWRRIPPSSIPERLCS
jgi:hypothetical protein